MPKQTKIKQSKPIKYVEFKDTRLNIPKVTILYKLRRTYWLLNNLHRTLQKDPTSISAKSYLDLLDVYCKLVDDVNKLGLGSNAERKKARERVDALRVGEVSNSQSKTGMGDSNPFSLGIGVSTPDSPA